MDALTGLRCQLLEHVGEGHCSERGPFQQVAQPGATHFPHAAELQRRATSNPEG